MICQNHFILTALLVWVVKKETFVGSFFAFLIFIQRRRFLKNNLSLLRNYRRSMFKNYLCHFLHHATDPLKIIYSERLSFSLGFCQQKKREYFLCSKIFLWLLKICIYLPMTQVVCHNNEISHWFSFEYSLELYLDLSPHLFTRLHFNL